MGWKKLLSLILLTAGVGNAATSYTVTASAQTGGTITTTTPVTQDSGTVWHFTAAANSGNTFATWLGATFLNGSGSSPTCSLKVTTNTNITAYFNVGTMTNYLSRWIILGQSNAMGSGTVTNPKRSRDTANALCIQDYYGDWRRLIDPSSQQGGAGASFLPSFGSYLANKYNCTQHFLNFAVSGTRLTGSDGTVWGYRNPSNHADVSTLYGLALAQIQAYWGANHCGIVWLQGESDADANVSDSLYDTTLTHFISWFRQDLGYKVPFIVIQIGRRPLAGGSATGSATIQNVQSKICNDTDIIYGASTYDLPLQSDSSHFDYAALDTIGKRLGIAVSYWLDNGVGKRFRASSIAANARNQINVITTTSAANSSKNDFEYSCGPYHPVITNISGTNYTLNADFSQNGLIRYAYGNAPPIVNLPKNADGFPLEPIQNWVTIPAYSGTYTSALTFNDKDLDFMLYFPRVSTKTSDQIAGLWPVYPLGCYTANMAGTGSGEGYVFNVKDSSYFLRTGANGKITVNKNLYKTSTSKFTFAFKIRYGLTTEDYITLFQFGTGTTMCQAYLRSITGSRALDFSTYVGGSDVGYAQAVSATLPTTQQDIFLCFVSDGSTLRSYVNGTESIYGFHVAYTGGTQEWDSLTMFNYSAVKVYWAAFFNDALSQARIDSLQALPNNLGLYGRAVGNTMYLSTSASGGNGMLIGGTIIAIGIGIGFSMWGRRKK